MRYSRNKEKRQIERQQMEDFVLRLGMREHEYIYYPDFKEFM